MWSAKLVERYDYDPYGRTCIEDPNGVRTAASRYGNPLAWTAQRYDAGVKLYGFFARTYSPELGRWLQRDPAGHVDGTNLYQYVRSMPTRLTDPLGLMGNEGDVGGEGGPSGGGDPPEPPPTDGPGSDGPCGGPGQGTDGPVGPGGPTGPVIPPDGPMTPEQYISTLERLREIVTDPGLAAWLDWLIAHFWEDAHRTKPGGEPPPVIHERKDKWWLTPGGAPGGAGALTSRGTGPSFEDLLGLSVVFQSPIADPRTYELLPKGPGGFLLPIPEGYHKELMSDGRYILLENGPAVATVSFWGYLTTTPVSAAGAGPVAATVAAGAALGVGVDLGIEYGIRAVTGQFASYWVGDFFGQAWVFAWGIGPTRSWTGW